jgi:hypothetical protein
MIVFVVIVLLNYCCLVCLYNSMQDWIFKPAHHLSIWSVIWVLNYLIYWLNNYVSYCLAKLVVCFFESVWKRRTVWGSCGCLQRSISSVVMPLWAMKSLSACHNLWITKNVNHYVHLPLLLLQYVTSLCSFIIIVCLFIHCVKYTYFF